MYLIDTDVVSALRRRSRDRRIADWVAAQRASELFLSVVTIGELEREMEARRLSRPETAERLGVWLDGLLRLYSNRILPVDLAVAVRWGRLSSTLGRTGADLIIAATALEHGLTVVTRDARRFELAGARALDPGAVPVPHSVPDRHPAPTLMP